MIFCTCIKNLGLQVLHLALTIKCILLLVVTNFIVDHLSNNSLGLDYGCGKGPVITEQLKKKGYEIDLYDPYFYPNETYLDKSYDYIFSCEVFEHFYNPKEELIKLKNILKKA